jgi:hypothetical protein
MNFDTVVADEAARYLEQVVARGEAPLDRECLRCYLDRMVGTYGCDRSLALTKQWMKATATPKPTTLIRWLQSRGGYCDCEVLINALDDHWQVTASSAPAR